MEDSRRLGTIGCRMISGSGHPQELVYTICKTIEPSVNGVRQAGTLVTYRTHAKNSGKNKQLGIT